MNLRTFSFRMKISPKLNIFEESGYLKMLGLLCFGLVCVFFVNFFIFNEEKLNPVFTFCHF